MVDAVISERRVRKLLRKDDVIRFELWREGAERDDEIKRIASEINSPEFEFPPFQKKVIRGNTVFCAQSIEPVLAIRAIDRELRAVYKVRQADRDLIINQVKSLLREGCGFFVLRLDLSNFYESIDRRQLLRKIERDGILSPVCRQLLDKLFSGKEFQDRNGLPRGLAVSATLSEMYLRPVDKHIRSLARVYYYSRYVDDMIVFGYGTPRIVRKKIRDYCKKRGVNLNAKKCEIISCSKQRRRNNRTFTHFEFLGYRFRVCEQLADKWDWRELSIGIAETKVKKIKSRIAKSFVAFLKSPDFQLLCNRLYFLCGNYVVNRSKNGTLCAGLAYNYGDITDLSVLDDLTHFLRSLIFARRGSIGRKLRGTLSDAQRQRLARLNFRTAFQKRITRSFSREEIKAIRRCWLYEQN